MSMGLAQSTIEKIVDNIRAVENPLRIILFGSYARGSSTFDSDLDLLIIKKQVKSRLKESLLIRNALREIRLPKDILVTSQEEFDFYKHQFGSIYKDINENGIVIYG